MPATYEPIATTTLGSAAATISFTSISSAYTDLRLVVVPTMSSASSYLKLNFNNDTASNYSDTILAGDGSSAASARDTNATQIWCNQYASNSTTLPACYTIDIFSYAGSTYKTALIATALDKNGSGSVERVVGLWRSTSAINRVDVGNYTGNLNTGTTATLYGILKA